MVRMNILVQIVRYVLVQKDMHGRVKRWFETTTIIRGSSAQIEVNVTVILENAIVGHRLKAWLVKETVVLMIATIKVCVYR